MEDNTREIINVDSGTTETVTLFSNFVIDRLNNQIRGYFTNDASQTHGTNGDVMVISSDGRDVEHFNIPMVNEIVDSERMATPSSTQSSPLGAQPMEQDLLSPEERERLLDAIELLFYSRGGLYTMYDSDSDILDYNFVDVPKTPTKIKVKGKWYSKTECKDKECFMCMEPYKKSTIIAQLECKHFIHKKCLKRWGMTNPTCPLCRSPIPSV